MWFVVIGKHQGQTRKVGSLGSPIQFVDGMIEVPDDAKDFQSLLSKFYSAYPAHECKQEEDGTIVWMGNSEDGNVRPNFSRKPVALREITVGAQATGSASVAGAEGETGEAEGAAAPPSEPPVFEKQPSKGKGK